MTKPILVVQGGSWGSESKGLVVDHLCKERDVDFAVRTGSINAGHTVYYNGKAYKFQQIPVGWTNPNTRLVIGGGAYISPEILESEVELIAQATGQDSDQVRERIFIDHRCGTHLHKHHAQEESSGIHVRMGSTGEGVAAAIVDKLDRKTDYALFRTLPESAKYTLGDTTKLLNEAYDNNLQILLEGTQGTMLDLHFGTYPYVTSRQTLAGAWATEAGLSPSLQYEVVLVVRQFPIRVAGNSGPFPAEIDWIPFMREVNRKRLELSLPVVVNEDCVARFEERFIAMSKMLGLPTPATSTLSTEERVLHASALSTVYKQTLDMMDAEDVAELKKLLEMTTVTKKVRRLARLDMESLKYAIRLNRPQYVVLNFLNYQFPSLFGVDTVEGIKSSPEFAELSLYLHQFEEETGVQVKYINTTADKIIPVDQIWN